MRATLHGSGTITAAGLTAGDRTTGSSGGESLSSGTADGEKHSFGTVAGESTSSGIIAPPIPVREPSRGFAAIDIERLRYRKPRTRGTVTGRSQSQAAVLAVAGRIGESGGATGSSALPVRGRSTRREDADVELLMLLGVL
jgi:hypothetical protein